MLELIFQGLIEWIYGLVLESWQYFVGAVLEVFSMDFAYMQTHVPVIDSILQICMVAGWALLIGNLVFQALKSMATGLGFEGEDPQLLFTRTFIFSFLLLASPQICKLGLSVTANIITLLQIPDAVDIIFPDAGVFGGLGAAWILVVIVGVIIMFKVLQLVFEIAERYVVLSVLTITAPLAFAMGGSRSTSDIFTGWCRMYGSMCLVMCTNVIFFKMLLSILSSVPTGLAVLPWMVLVMSIVKVAKKIDNIITRIGLNPAITGDSLGRSFPGMLAYTVMRSMTSQVVKTVGKSGGSAAGAKGAAGKAPPGGGSGAHFGAGFGGGGRRGTTGGPGHASAYQQQSTTATGGATQTSNQQTATQEQTVNAGTTQNSQQTQASATRSSQTSRRSSVNMQSQRGAWERQPGATAPAGSGSQFSGLGSVGKGTPRPGAVPSAGSPPGTAAPAGKTVSPAAGMGHQGGEAPVIGHPSTPNGVAGTAPAGAARFTQQGTQISHEGGSQSSVNAQEQNHARSSTTIHAAPPAAKGTPIVSPPAAAGTPQAPAPTTGGSSAQRAETRFSQAQKTAAAPPSPHSPPTPAGMSAAPQNPPGAKQGATVISPAGGSVATHQGTRPSRNERRTDVPSGVSAASHPTAQPPQTPHTPTPRPGPAGTTARTNSAEKTTGQARHEAAKTPSVPGNSVGGRTVTHGKGQQRLAQNGGIKSARKTQGGQKYVR